MKVGDWCKFKCHNKYIYGQIYHIEQDGLYELGKKECFTIYTYFVHADGLNFHTNWASPLTKEDKLELL